MPPTTNSVITIPDFIVKKELCSNYEGKIKLELNPAQKYKIKKIEQEIENNRRMSDYEKDGIMMDDNNSINDLMYNKGISTRDNDNNLQLKTNKNKNLSINNNEILMEQDFNKYYDNIDQHKNVNIDLEEDNYDPCLNNNSKIKEDGKVDNNIIVLNKKRIRKGGDKIDYAKEITALTNVLTNIKNKKKLFYIDLYNLIKKKSNNKTKYAIIIQLQSKQTSQRPIFF